MIRIRSSATRIFLFCAFAASLLAVLTACGRTEANANNEANTAFDEGEYQQALDDYERVGEELPERPEPDYNAANARYRLEDYERAQEELGAALLDSYSVGDEDLAARTLFNLGNALFQAEDYEGAIEEYKNVLRQNPDDVDAKRNLELALRQIEEQQQQQQEQQQQQDQQQQGQGDQPGPPDQPDDEGDDEQEGPESDREGVGQDPENQQRGDGSEQPSQDLERPGANPQQQEMTPGQALDLLNAVGQNTDTLQSRLPPQFADYSPPERDW